MLYFIDLNIERSNVVPRSPFFLKSPSYIRRAKKYGWYNYLMDLTKIDFETNRLRLVTQVKNYHEFDKEIFKELNEEITAFLICEPFNILEETKKAVSNRYEKILAGKDISLRVLDKKTEEFLGHATLTEVDTQTPELGIWIKKSAHGSGYGKEAMQGLKEWAEKHLNYDYLLYPVDKRNISSIKIAESLGGVIGRMYDKKFKSGKLLHTIDYKIYKNKDEKYL